MFDLITLTELTKWRCQPIRCYKQVDHQNRPEIINGLMKKYCIIWTESISVHMKFNLQSKYLHQPWWVYKFQSHESVYYVRQRLVYIFQFGLYSFWELARYIVVELQPKIFCVLNLCHVDWNRKILNLRLIDPIHLIVRQHRQELYRVNS